MLGPELRFNRFDLLALYALYRRSIQRSNLSWTTLFTVRNASQRFSSGQDFPTTTKATVQNTRPCVWSSPRVSSCYIPAWGDDL